MALDVFAALIHYPVVDKNGLTVATSITNLDIHDIARAARTFGLKGYFLVTPVEPQHWLAERIMGHWREGWGAQYNPTRTVALDVVQLKSDIGAVEDAIIEKEGAPPRWVATSARNFPNSVSYETLRKRIREESGAPLCLLFGTGYGLHPEIVMEADYVLEPIRGGGEFNHLSVRSAASIIFDRLLAADRI